MPWLKSEGKAPRNDKLWELSDAAYRLYDAGRHYAVENLTDAHVPLSRVSSLTPKPAGKMVIRELMKVRGQHPLWHELPEICDQCVQTRAEHHAQPLAKTGYLVHDFFHYNPSKAEYEAALTKRRAAGHMGGVAKGQNARLGREFQAMVDELEGHCPRCGKVSPLVRDHILPIHMGGEDVIENIQPLCRPCNSAKGKETTNWLEQWRADRSGMPSTELSTVLSTELSAKPSGALSSDPGSAPAPYPVPRKTDRSVPRAHAREAVDPEPVDDPEPVGPSARRAAGSVDPGVRREARRSPGLRHVGQVIREGSG